MEACSNFNNNFSNYYNTYIMSKLISNPFECGYVDQEPNYRDDICKHPKNAGGQCPGSMTEFPTHCPLPEGYPKEQLNDEQLFPKCTHHKHTYYKNGKRVYPRRNRKDCIYHILKYDKYGRCDNRNRLKTLCSGVNCGDFKTTT